MDLKQKVFSAARDYGISSVLFRNSIAQKLGLNVTDYECLSLLSIKGISTAKEISQYTGLTTGSTTAMLDRLEKKKFIKRKANPNDRRGVLVEVNPEYSKKAAPLVADVQKDHRDLIASYSDKELKLIADFLEKFTGNVVKHT